jgi:hypothetical protein
LIELVRLHAPYPERVIDMGRALKWGRLSTPFQSSGSILARLRLRPARAPPR